MHQHINLVSPYGPEKTGFDFDVQWSESVGGNFFVGFLTIVMADTYGLYVVHNIEEAKEKILDFQTQTISGFCVLRSNGGFGTTGKYSIYINLSREFKKNASNSFSLG